MKKKISFKMRAALAAAILVSLLVVIFTGIGNVKAAETGGEAVSENDASPSVCVCEEKCSTYKGNEDCPVCQEDRTKCSYKEPKVVIRINRPSGWYTDTAAVTFTVTDTADSGNFELTELKAKIGQNGSWTDVTEEKELAISENCTVYVQAVDQKGNTYEKNRAIQCFDNTKPTLNAAVSDGLLSIQAHDTDSGVKAVYVNGYEFTDLTNGTLNIRLQQFDAGYEYFTITAMDYAGNLSEVYRIKNPYYQTDEEESGENAAEQLPQSAEATDPGSATAAVTEHSETDSEGNIISQAGETGEDGNENQNRGKEFYTIQTASEKVFYLIIDRDGEEETVYFLTEITENDLLNTISDHTETLPKNSAAVESAIPVTENALPNNNTGITDGGENKAEEADTDGGTEETPEEEERAGETAEKPEEDAQGQSPAAGYIIMGILAAAATAGGYYFKVVRKKKEDFLEDDEEEEYEEDYPEEEEEREEDDDGDDGFFEEPDE